jgi:signal transduction histidine kinase
MRVGQRLFLAVIPAVLGVLTVAALVYWGEYGRQAPIAIVVTAAVASLISLAVAWYNTRYVAQRIERLAAEAKAVRRSMAEAGVEAMRAAGLGDARPDELESIERLIERLSGAAVSAERSAREREAAAEARARQHDALLRDMVSELARSVDEIRLPLHILLENRFGDLNENQEEMLGAARAAAEATDERLRTVATTIAATDGTLALRRDRIRGGELAAFSRCSGRRHRNATLASRRTSRRLSHPCRAIALTCRKRSARFSVWRWVERTRQRPYD